MLRNNNQYKIKTPNGYESFLGVNQIEKDSVELTFSNGEKIICSKKHVFILVNKKETKAIDITKNDEIITINGCVKLVDRKEIGSQILYDVVNAGKDYIYYTNGILSHNCKFLASSNSLITAEVMERMEFAEELQFKRIPIYKKIMKINKNFHESVHMYEKPKAGHEYVIGVDPAKITEDSSGDSLAMQILDVTQLPFRQVATIVINDGIHYLEVPAFLAHFGYYYNEAFIFIENNDQVGLSIADSLNLDWDYENVFSEKAGVFGFRTTSRTKKMACLALKMLIETRKLIIRDITTISQMSTYIKKATSYEAEIGYSDDAVSALLASLVFLQDRMGWEHKIGMVSDLGFNTVSAIEPEKRLERNEQVFKSIEEKEDMEFEDVDPVPFGFSSHGEDIFDSIF